MTPTEIRNKRFEKKGMGGYRMEEVHAFLEEVAVYAEDLQRGREEAEEKMAVLADKLEEYREDEESLRAALIGAQKLGNSVVSDARRKAELLLSEASAKAEELVSDAKSNLDREAVALTRMQAQVAEFKAQILNMYKRHIEVIQSIPDEPSLPRDVQKIVDKVSAAPPPPPRPVQEQEEKVKNFELSYEEEQENDLPPPEDLEDLQRMSAAEPGGKHAKYGDLRFGEEYNLTRKD